MRPEPPPTSQVEDPFSLPAYEPSTDERLFALLVHLLPAILYASVVLPILVPIIVIAAKGNESRWVKAHAYEALNFQLTIIIFSIIGIVLSVVGIGICMLLGMAAFAFIIGIIAGVKSYGGYAWRYPFCIRFLKL
ncbi:MAG: hypothetical protein AMXMBFR34_33500 [Myxococcaceae bacterium]